MLTTETAHLAMQMLVMAAAIVGLFHLRGRFGLAPLYVFVGGSQYVQTVLASTTTVDLFGRFPVSPGSVVMFSSHLFAILLVYVRSSLHATRTLIYAVALANLLLTAIGVLMRLGSPDAADQIMAVLPDTRTFLVGTLMLVVDALLIIAVYEFLTFRWVVAVPVRTCLTLTAVLCLDGVLFVTGSFAGDDAYGSILLGNIVGKCFAGMIYGLALGAFLAATRSETGTGLEQPRRFRDLFSIVTYRERWALLRDEKEEQERTHQEEQRLARESLDAHGAALAAFEERHRLITENVSDMISVLDTDGVIRYVSPSVADYGIRPDDVLGRPLLEFVHPEDREGVDERYRRLVTDAEPCSATFRMRFEAEGEWRWVECAGSLLSRGRKGADEVVLVSRDVTARVFKELGLARYREELERQVVERTQEIRRAMDLMAGREVRMAELKRRIDELEGRGPRENAGEES